MNKILAQSINVGGQAIEGPLEGVSTLGDIVNKIVSLLIPLAGIILLFVLIWGGYDFMMSRGQPDKLKGAQAKITTGIIGFVLLIFAYAIVKILTSIFGLGEGIF